MEQHSGLNIVDLSVFAVILISGALALWRGFVRECLSVLAWVGAAAVTVYFYPSLRPWMHEHVKTDFAADALTGLALFCGSLVVFIPIGYILAGLVQGKALTAIDRSLGFVFGLARGALLVCLIFLLTLWVWPEKEKEPAMLAEARTRPFLAYGAAYMKQFVPEDKMKKVEEHVHSLEQKSDAISTIDQAPKMTTTGTTSEPTPAAATTTAPPPPEPPPEKPQATP